MYERRRVVRQEPGGVRFVWHVSRQLFGGEIVWLMQETGDGYALGSQRQMALAAECEVRVRGPGIQQLGLVYEMKLPPAPSGEEVDQLLQEGLDAAREEHGRVNGMRRRP